MTRSLPFVFAIAVVVFSGAVQGVRINRWGNSREFELACARLDKVPKTFGDWESTDVEMDPHAVQRAGIAAYLQRHYRNRRTGESIMVFLVCGLPGPISRHTPDVCYANTGYELVASQTKASLGPKEKPENDEFWRLEMTRSESFIPKRLLIYYGWNNDGHWKAPSGERRYVFAASPFLYKIYVSREVVPVGETTEDASGRAFIRELLPELRKSLFPKA